MGLLLVMMLLLAACGGDSSSGGTSGGSANDEGEAESAPPTRTPFPTFAYEAPTNPPVFNQNAESTDEADESAEATETSDEVEAVVELDPKLVERGLGRYEALECGVCHGEAGEGTDGIIGLAGTELSEDDFITFLRSGGTIGSSHQYSTDRLSRNGSINLYTYILSLSQGE
mgnify:CR=1 FL=1